MAKRGALSQLVDALKTPRHLHEPDLLDFQLVNVEQIASTLRLQELGEERGSQGDPSTASSTFDNVEQRIVTKIEDAQTLAHGKYLAHLQTLTQRLAGLDLGLFVTQVREAALSTQGDFNALVRDGKNQLHLAKKRFLETDAELNEFRQVHRLRRPARSPDSRLWQFGVLSILFIVEAALNGGFLGEAHQFGLLGGYTEAISVAFLNVFTAFLVGWVLLPYLLHRSWITKFLTAVTLIPYLTFILALNLGFAHYRDILVNTLSADAAQLVLQNLITNPLGITDVKSWMLFILAMVFWVIALFDGFRMDDPYPGYGPLGRRYEDAVNEYSSIKAELYDDLASYRDENTEAMDRAKRELENSRGESVAINTSRRKLQEGYARHLKHLQQAGNELLAIYRQANSAARRSAGKGEPPRRFEEPWRLSASMPEEVLELDLIELDSQVQQTVSQLDELIRDVHRSYDEALAQFDRIDQLAEIRGNSSA